MWPFQIEDEVMTFAVGQRVKMDLHAVSRRRRSLNWDTHCWIVDVG